MGYKEQKSIFRLPYRRHTFYLNLVGYKEGVLAFGLSPEEVFYLNLVGYKADSRKVCRLRLVVLSELSGI